MVNLSTLQKTQAFSMDLDNEDSLDAPPSVGSDSNFMTPMQRKVRVQSHVESSPEASSRFGNNSAAL